MKITKLSKLRPLEEIEPMFVEFLSELEKLSNRYAIAFNTCGGFLFYDNERDRVRYERNPCTGDLTPVVEEIDRTAETVTPQSDSKPDLKVFSEELKELGGRYNFTLVSFGGLVPQVGNEQTMFLAVWNA